MDRRILYGLVIIMITASLIALLVSIPEKAAGCKSNDGQCPSGCTYDRDTDCGRSTITSSGEIRRCFTDANCVIVKPICGNERCDFNDRECQTECSCGVAINKDYKTVFEAASTTCLPSGKACAQCSGTQTAICMSGECKIITS